LGAGAFIVAGRLMIPAATPQEAMFVIERKLLTARARCERIRYFPYPGPDRRLVIACAELADGSDIQELARLDSDRHDRR
jgi:hypothetical protein